MKNDYYFGHNAKMEEYANLSSDMPKLDDKSIKSKQNKVERKCTK